MFKRDKKIQLLWISSSAPNKKVGHAGGHTFNYYFNSFVRDDCFKVKLISVATLKEKKNIENSSDYKIIYRDAVSNIYKLSNIESTYNLFNRHANLISNYCAKQIIKELKRLKNNNYVPDVIILEWTNIVVMAREIKKIFPNSKIVASEHDVTFIGYDRKRQYFKGLKKLIWNIKYKHEKKIELLALKICDLISIQNSDNRQVLCESGIDNNRILRIVPYFNNMSDVQRDPKNRDVLFFGAMGRMENSLSALWFIDNVMPSLKDLGVRFVVLGGNPPEDLKSRECDNIHITGFVDDIKPYFQTSMCFVAPLVLGAGIKVKVLEALSSGIPVLTNDIGIEGIDAENGREYFHCVTPGDYIKVIEEIATNRIDLNHIEKVEKTYISSNYSIEESAVGYRNQILKLIV